MKNFNTLTIDQQLALRVYNLEMSYSKEMIVNYIHTALNVNSPDFDDDTIVVNKDNPVPMLGIQVIQIVRYFGKELTLRFLSFNFKEELERIGA